MQFDGLEAPRLMVDVAFVPNPGSDATFTTPYLRLDYALTPLDTGILADETIWHDITNDVLSISTRRGRNSEFEQGQTGTCDLVIDNHSGEYDPTNPASRYYRDGRSDVVPMRQVRVRCEYAGITYPLYRGYINDYDFDFSYNPRVTFQCVDGMGALAALGLKTIAPVGDNELSGARISRILDSAGWPATLRAIDPGQSHVNAATYGGNALELLHQVAKSEIGLNYVNSSGEFTFLDRGRLDSNPRSMTPQALFSDDPDEPGSIDYLSLGMRYSANDIANSVSANRPGGTEQVATDSTSILRYGQRDLPVSFDDLTLRNDTDVLNFANYLLAKFKDPDIRISTVAVEAMCQPGNWPALLGMSMFDLVTAVRDYGPNVISRDVLIQGIDHDITPDSWRITFDTFSPDRFDAFILDTSRLGLAQITF